MKLVDQIPSAGPEDAMHGSLGRRKKSKFASLGEDYMLDIEDEDETKGRGKGRSRGKWGSKEHIDYDDDDDDFASKGKGKKARKLSTKGRSAGASLLIQRMDTEDLDLIGDAEERASALRRKVEETRGQAKHSTALAQLEGELNGALMIAQGPSRCQSFTSDLSVIGAWMDSVAISEWILSFRNPLIPEAPSAGALDLLYGAAHPLLSPRTIESLFRSVLKCTLQLWAQVSGHSSRLAHRTRRWLRMIRRGHAWQEVLRRWLLISRVGLAVNEEDLSLPPHQMDDVTTAAACAVELGKMQAHQINPSLMLRTLRVLVCDLLDTNAFGTEMLARENALDELEGRGKFKPRASLASSVSLEDLSSDPKALDEALMRKAEREREARRSLIRSEPLGSDRHQRVYYHLTSTGGLIFVEEPEGQGLGAISSIQELDGIIAGLNPKGTRESVLLHQLSLNYDLLCSSLFRLSFPASNNGTRTILQEMFPRELSTLPQKMLSSVMEASKEFLSLPPAAAAAAEAEAEMAAAEAAAVGRNCKGKAAMVASARAAAEAALVADGDHTIYYQGPERRFKDLFSEEDEAEEEEAVVEGMEEGDDEGSDEGMRLNQKIDLRTKEGRELKRLMLEEGTYPEKKGQGAASSEPKVDLRTKEGRELKRLMLEEKEKEAKRAEAIKNAAIKARKLEEEREMDLGSLIQNDVASGLSVACLELAWLIKRIKVVNHEPVDAWVDGSWRRRASEIDQVQPMLQVLIDAEAELQSLADGQPEAATNEDLAPLVKEAEDFEVEFVLPPDDEDGEDSDDKDEDQGKELWKGGTGPSTLDPRPSTQHRYLSQRKLVIELEELDDSETEDRQRDKMNVAAAIVTELAAGTDPSLLQPKPRIGLWRTRRDRAVWLRDVRRCQLSGLMTHSLYVLGLLVDRAEVLLAGIVVLSLEAERRANRISAMPRPLLQPRIRSVSAEGGEGGEGDAAAVGGRGKRAASLGVNALIAKVGSRKLKREQEEREATFQTY